jgi:hypothetical protein
MDRRNQVGLTDVLNAPLALEFSSGVRIYPSSACFSGFRKKGESFARAAERPSML